MADETVTLTKLTGGSTFNFHVDKPSIKMQAGQTIKFVNSLNPDGEIHIQFFMTAADKFASPPIPISGFGKVDGNTIGDTLIIPKNDAKDCEIVADVVDGDQILYSVKAVDTPGNTEYAPLDPVVIIDGPDSAIGPQKPGINPLLVPVAALAGLVIGYAIWG